MTILHQRKLKTFSIFLKGTHWLALLSLNQILDVLLLEFQKWLNKVTLHLPEPFKNPGFHK